MNFAILALAAMQATTPLPPCGCAQFAPVAAAAVALSPAPEAPLSAGARAVRDFALYSHRRIAEDLVRQRGLYLDTLLAYFPHCADPAAKLGWLRHTLASNQDTRDFADRLAQQHESSRSCGAPG